LGVGSTNTVAVIGVPEQPLITGVIVNVTVMAALLLFVKVPDIFPLPEFGIPVTDTVLFLVQLNIVPGVFPDITIVVIAEAEHFV
jgi:hypothetical protein